MKTTGGQNMIDSIFAPSFGNRPKYMVGRDTIKKQLQDSYTSSPGSKERATLILGQRGTGKTVLLLEAADIARQYNYIVASPTIVASGMCDRIVEKIQEAAKSYIKEARPKITSVNIELFGIGGGVGFETESATKSFGYKVSKLVAEINKIGKSVLILIDEVQANNEELRQLIIAYQEMVGEGLDVMLILAGLPMALSSLLNDKVLTFMNRANKIYLSPLPTGEIDSYFARAFDSLGIKLSAARRKEAAEKTQGSPYMMQLVGHYIVLYASDNGDVSEASFNDALETAKSYFLNDICKTTLDALSQKDQEFLLTAATVEKSNIGIEIAAVADNMNVSKQYAQNYRQRLIQSGIIEPAGRGLIRFAVPYLEDYLKQLQEA